MKIAIQLSGEPRFTGDFDLFLKHLEGYTEADWFIYLTNYNQNRQDFHNRRGVSMIPQWQTFSLDWATDKISSNLPKNNTIQNIQISDCHLLNWPDADNLFDVYEDMTINVYNMYYNIYKANELRLQFEKETGTEYDVVIRMRTDVGIARELNLQYIDLNTNTIYMPDNGWWGAYEFACNDQIAISDPNSMNIYSTTVHHIHKYNSQGVIFHPETLLGYHLVSNNINMKRGGYEVTLRTLQHDITKWS